MIWSLLNILKASSLLFAKAAIKCSVNVCVVIDRRRCPRRINRPNVFTSSILKRHVNERDTFKHIETGSAVEIAIYFKLSFPYLSRSISLRPLRVFLSPSSFPPSVFQLGLRLTLPSSERMAARLLGSPPAQIAFARAQNL